LISTRRWHVPDNKRTESAKIEVTNIRAAKGKVICYADVKIGGFILIKGVNLYEHPELGVCLGSPQKSWQGRDAVTRYTNIVEFFGNAKAAIRHAIEDAWVANLQSREET
jgi:hypothetical protein